MTSIEVINKYILKSNSKLLYKKQNTSNLDTLKKKVKDVEISSLPSIKSSLLIILKTLTHSEQISKTTSILIKSTLKLNRTLNYTPHKMGTVNLISLHLDLLRFLPSNKKKIEICMRLLKNDGYELHRDQIWIGRIWHESITRILVGSDEVEGLNECWPRKGNTDKVVRLLQIVEDLVTNGGSWLNYRTRVLESISDPNWRINESSLRMFSSQKFREKVFEEENDCKGLIKVLANNLEKGWNITVDKYRYLVLKSLEEEIGEEFGGSLEELYGEGGGDFKEDDEGEKR